MSEVITIQRDLFLRSLGLVKPALSGQSYVPVLSHVCFRPDSFYAYNDLMAITVKLATGLHCAIPGDLLSKLVSSMSSESIMVTLMDGQAMVSGGRSRVKLPILEPSHFIFTAPDGGTRLGAVMVDDDFLTGMERCLISVGNDPARPAAMGVTLVWLKEGVSLFSTDNYSISRYTADATKYEFASDTPVILPSAFCEQLVAMSKVFRDEEITVEIFSDYIMAFFGSRASIFSKFVLDTEPMDFDRLITKYLGDGTLVGIPIPDTLEPAFARAMLVLDTEKVTKVSIDEKRLMLATSTQSGDVRDQVNLVSGVPEYVEFCVNPALVSRACSVSSEMIPKPDVLVTRGHDGKFLHMIAHVASSAKN